MTTIETIERGAARTITIDKRTFRLHGVDHGAQFFPSQQLLVISDGRAVVRHELNFSSSRILEVLIDRSDDMVTRKEIFAFAWPGRVVGQNSLNQAISLLREVLRDDEQRMIIQTLPRRGYRFNAVYLDRDGAEWEADIRLMGQEGVEKNATALDDQLQRTELKKSAEAMVRRYKPPLLITMGVVMFMALVFRIDWGLWAQPGLFSVEETVGNLKVHYVAATPQKVVTLKDEVLFIRERFVKFAQQPETVIFNKTHGFFEMTCIDQGAAVRFLTVHKSKLSQVSDVDLARCIYD
ncbi:winged helix-turn-helix domain-containing protein [Pseudomonas sp. MDT1-17]